MGCCSSNPYIKHGQTDFCVEKVRSELRTERLYLRCPREGDGAAVHEAVVESLQHLRAWPASLPWALAVPSVEASEAFCRESAASFLKRTSFVFLAFDHAGDFVASTSLHGINWGVPKFEIGFWCRATMQRNGYTTEAVSRLIQYAMTDLGANRVDAITDERNAASRAVCEASGMQLEGVLRNENITPSGMLCNNCVYAVVSSRES